MQEFKTSGVPTVEVDNLESLSITEGTANQVVVNIEGPEKARKKIRCKQHGDRVVVRGPKGAGGGGTTVISSGGSSISIGGSVSGTSIISSGGNVVVTGGGRGGRVVVDGVDVTQAVREGKSGDTEADEPVRITITVPAGCNFKVGDIGAMETQVALGNVELDSSGNSEVTLGQVEMLSGSVKGCAEVSASKVNAAANIALGGTGNVRISEMAGSLSLTLGGQSEANVSGTFDQVNATTGGQSSVTTTGIVKGNYLASSSGQSGIVHNGTVEGQVLKSSSGQSSIRV